MSFVPPLCIVFALLFVKGLLAVVCLVLKGILLEHHYFLHLRECG